MSYVEKIKEYARRFPQELEFECLIQIKKLRKQGFSYEWIYRAIEHKDYSEWSKWGFGLLHTETYQNQITNLLAAERNQLEDIDLDNLSWDSLLEEEQSTCAAEVKQSETLEELFAEFGVNHE